MGGRSGVSGKVNSPQMFSADNRVLPLRRTSFVSPGICVMVVRPSTRSWSTVAGGIGLMIILLTLSCASKRFDHPALDYEGSASAELTIIRSREFTGSCCPFCLRMDGETIVCLRIGRYATVRLRPDRYELSSRGWQLFDRHRPDFEIDMEALEIDLEVGETAYVAFGVWRGITIVTPEEGKALMREYKRVGED